MNDSYNLLSKDLTRYIIIVYIYIGDFSYFPKYLKLIYFHSNFV